jgi:hypothetical protein
MLNAILFWIRFVILAFSGHKQVALENAALRQQVGRVQARCEAAKVAWPRSPVLDRPKDDVGGLEVGAGDRST